MHIESQEREEQLNSCVECGSTRLVERTVEQQFAYGEASKAVTLRASFPVTSCEECGYQSFDERGEMARYVAICRHLGIQTPDEIRKARESTGLSRAEYCELTGFGLASLQRWESGANMPNASNDRLIYLLTERGNVLRLQARSNQMRESASTPIARISEHSPDPRRAVVIVHTKCTTRNFNRFGNRARAVLQAASWNPRGR